MRRGTRVLGGGGGGGTVDATSNTDVETVNDNPYIEG
jgi:hypothetical protein